MKRSTINGLIAEAKALFAEHHFRLPPFAFWTPQDWAGAGHEADEIRDNGLGWDVTDFGAGDFEALGLLLFTIRNGNYQNPDRYPKLYAEKVMVVKPRQVTTLALSFDHRLVDGELGSKVLADVAAILEQPKRLITWA